MNISLIDLVMTFFVGVVEGITEWLPVSSTAHIELFKHFFKIGFTKEFFELFEVVIQFGAVMAVVVFYFNKLFPFSFRKGDSFIKKDIFNVWVKILISCLPAAIIGILFDDLFTKLFYHPTPIAIALMVFGILFIFIETFNKKKPSINAVSEITYTIAFWIGVFQVVAAVFPGVSRSGATIIGALLIGVSRTVAAEYTFYLAVPVMAGASLLKLMKFGLDFTASELIYLAVGTVTSFLVSVLAIKFLVGYVKKHDFKPFGVYRIILGILVLLFL